MSVLFMDTSAISKRYANEMGTAWVRQQVCKPAGNSVVLSAITRAELVSVLARKAREGVITADDRDRLLRAFRAHCGRQYRFVAVADEVIRAAAALLLKHRLRTYDAMQLASATTMNGLLVQAGLGPLTFVCSDVDLCTIACTEGLFVQNPENHP